MKRVSVHLTAEDIDIISKIESEGVHTDDLKALKELEEDVPFWINSSRSNEIFADCEDLMAIK